MIHKRYGLISGSERFPGGGNGNLLQYSCLENPMDIGAWRATVHGIVKSQTWLSMHAWYSILYTHTYKSVSQFSHSVVSDSLQPHELQHTRPPCPSPTPRVHPNPCPLSWWCQPFYLLLPCFIPYSKAKFACYYRWFLISHFCIPVPNNEKDIFRGC